MPTELWTLSYNKQRLVKLVELDLMAQEWLRLSCVKHQVLSDTTQQAKVRVRKRRTTHCAGWPLHFRMSIPQNLSQSYDEKLVGFQQHVVKLWKEVDYQLGLIREKWSDTSVPWHAISAARESIPEELVRRPSWKPGIASAFQGTEGNSLWKYIKGLSGNSTSETDSDRSLSAMQM